jgi:hypothetical protein
MRTSHSMLCSLRSDCNSQPDFVFPTIVYELSDVLDDLMSFSAAHLRPHGRLVFWIPLIRDTMHQQVIPQHPQLHLVSNCEQAFNQCMLSNLVCAKSHRVSKSLDLCQSRVSFCGCGGRRHSEISWRTARIPRYGIFPWNLSNDVSISTRV